ncbi:MAG: ATP-binding protein [candidate division KSB1 bacterium]|nr:ATP-binding protein [candidate division KSB1 bacterium]
MKPMATEKQKTPDNLTTMTIELSIPSAYGCEKIAMDTARAVARWIGLSEERTEDLRTAVSEACLNAIQHGNRLKADRPVRLVFALSQKKLSVDVIDSGMGIRRRPKTPDLEAILAKNVPSRGWGLYLIEHLVDAVEYHRSKKHGHVTRLIVNLA